MVYAPPWKCSTTADGSPPGVSTVTTGTPPSTPGVVVTSSGSGMEEIIS
jgi:hypothetical protein